MTNLKPYKRRQVETITAAQYELPRITFEEDCMTFEEQGLEDGFSCEIIRADSLYEPDEKLQKAIDEWTKVEPRLRNENSYGTESIQVPYLKSRNPYESKRYICPGDYIVQVTGADGQQSKEVYSPEEFRSLFVEVVS
jgi:hypothetical protein